MFSVQIYYDDDMYQINFIETFGSFWISDIIGLFIQISFFFFLFKVGELVNKFSKLMYTII